MADYFAEVDKAEAENLIPNSEYRCQCWMEADYLIAADFMEGHGFERAAEWFRIIATQPNHLTFEEAEQGKLTYEMNRLSGKLKGRAYSFIGTLMASPPPLKGNANEQVAARS